MHGCLQSVLEVMDEIIVVDTGSTDRTVEIAREHGARVFEYVWNDDFSAARNESLEHATGDWIFQIDADERLDPDSKGEFRKWLNDRSNLCVNVLIDSPKAGGHKKGHISRAHRLFRNLPGIRYSGRIHEQLSPSVMALNGREGFSNILLHHLGYAKEEAEMIEKSQRNYRLLTKQIDDEPENPYWHFTLAQNLILSRRYDEARTHLHQALALGNLPKDIRCSIHNNLAEIHLRAGEHEQAVRFAEQALAVTKKQTTSYLLLFEIYGHLKDNQKQIECLEAAIALAEKKQRAVNEISLEAYVDLPALYMNLGHKYFAEKSFQQAGSRYKQALARMPGNLSAMKGLGDCLIQGGEFEQAERLLEQIRKRAPNDVLNLEKLAWLAIKMKKFVKAISIYEALLAFTSMNQEVMKRLAGLYNHVGKRNKSRELLLRAHEMQKTDQRGGPQ